jgi:hypothetical protein
MEKVDRIRTIQKALENLSEDERAQVAECMKVLNSNPTFDTAQVWEIAQSFHRIVQEAR